MATDNFNHLGEQDTLVPGSEVVSSKPVADFPDELAQRFQLIDTLGQGGAGTVFLVFDQNLQRQVALKLLSAPQADMQLLLMEARAQAKLKHPHICPIFDVGQCQQQVFMVMQFVPGLPLHKLAPQLSLEQKLIVMEQVCLGLQHAHSNSLIHRDIKPSNILVEQDDDGQLQAYIVDFGLAHQQQQQQSLAHQAGLGTPQFMAPEQLQKQAADTDRRVDIYSIGASLYQLICGQAPVCIGDSNKAEVADAISQDVNRLAKLVAEDLQTIILKCLEPQASLRYSSAREVALELRRYLEGEPIKAHRGLSYRLGKKLRKHKLVVGLVAMVLVTLVGSGGYQLYQQHQQQIREQLLQDFTADVENLEARVRFTHMSPQQNISPLKQQWRTQVENIQTNMHRLGNIASGPGNYAIGRMLYAFQQYEVALKHLQQAWSGGFQQPRVAYMLGLTLAELYQVKSLQALNIESDKTRQTELARLDAEYRQPAMTYLQQSNQLAQYQGYASALALYLQQDYQQAINELEQAQLPPWFYEKQQLLARLTLQQAEDLYANGEKDKANQLYQQALDISQQGLEIAPNSMQMHNIYASILLRQVVNRMYDQGSPEQTIQQGLAATQQASQIDNLQLDNILLEADLLFRYSNQLLMSHDGRVESINKRLTQLVERALNIWKKDSRLLRFLGSASYQKFSLDVKNEYYNQKAIDKALKAFSAIPSEKRDYRYYAILGELYLNVAKIRKDFGLEKSDYYQKAFSTFEAAKKVGVENSRMLINYAMAMVNLAKAEFNPESEKLFNKAISELSDVSQKSANSFVANFYLTRAYLELATWQLNLNQLDRQQLLAAENSANAALALKQDNYYLWYELIKTQRYQLYNLLLKGQNSQGKLDKYLSLLDKVYQQFPQHSYSANNNAYQLLGLAELYLQQGRDNKRLLEKAQGYIKLSKGKAPEIWVKLNQAYWYYLAGFNQPEKQQEYLISGLELLNTLTLTDHWSVNLQAKLQHQLALVDRQSTEYWLTADKLYRQAIALRPYQVRYYAQLACLLTQVKQLQPELTLEAQISRPEAIQNVPLASCRN